MENILGFVCNIWSVLHILLIFITFKNVKAILRSMNHSLLIPGKLAFYYLKKIRILGASLVAQW